MEGIPRHPVPRLLSVKPRSPRPGLFLCKVKGRSLLFDRKQRRLETSIDGHFEDQRALADPAFHFNEYDDRKRDQEYGHGDPEERCVLMLSHVCPLSVLILQQAIPAPLLDLVEVAPIRVEGIVGFFVGPVVGHPGGHSVGGSTGK
jgi:hypothetical protein